MACACGRTHACTIGQIRIGRGVLTEVAEAVRCRAAGRPVLVVADTRTRAACGCRVEAALRLAGVPFTTCILTAEPVVPDEPAVAAVRSAVCADHALLLAVGSGTINDLTRYAAAQTGRPFVAVATAASMDGYASSVAPLIVGGRKITFPAVQPAALFADTEVLAAAPAPLLAAGFGDILGKETALADWRLAHAETGEYWCPFLDGLVREALGRCRDAAADVARRGDAAAEVVAEALVLSGVAISLADSSRPASGAEHHVSHYWEMDALANGRPHALHGQQVGVATPCIAAFYQALEIGRTHGITVPPPGELRALLRLAGCETTPQRIGISEALLVEALERAYTVRDRYTVFTYAQQQGRLEELARRVANEAGEGNDG